MVFLKMLEGNLFFRTHEFQSVGVDSVCSMLFHIIIIITWSLYLRLVKAIVFGVSVFVCALEEGLNGLFESVSHLFDVSRNSYGWTYMLFHFPADIKLSNLVIASTGCACDGCG
ncbi:hypothetical protein XENOCAPTIV_007870 [Xenoophorus captivus]|uniref:Uncharacterized protein n=1 Tax=Xenoophorus captivus TaxID=1517983 RepID=A0ABV0Q3N0_9TELE